MKKIYEKPYICVESFTISDFIAGDCEHDVGYGDLGTTKLCSIKDPDFPSETLFNDPSVCSVIWDEDTNKGCYHIPTGGHGYFGS